jgi:alpha-D-ribose 1-methylphosphonate 5-triphosphate diphosphatase PhnM
MNSPTSTPVVFTNAQLVLQDEVVKGSLISQHGLIHQIDQVLFAIVDTN